MLLSRACWRSLSRSISPRFWSGIPQSRSMLTIGVIVQEVKLPTYLLIVHCLETYSTCRWGDWDPRSLFTLITLSIYAVMCLTLSSTLPYSALLHFTWPSALEAQDIERRITPQSPRESFANASSHSCACGAHRQWFTIHTSSNVHCASLCSVGHLYPFILSNLFCYVGKMQVLKRIAPACTWKDRHRLQPDNACALPLSARRRVNINCYRSFKDC